MYFQYSGVALDGTTITYFLAANWKAASAKAQSRFFLAVNISNTGSNIDIPYGSWLPGAKLVHNKNLVAGISLSSTVVVPNVTSPTLYWNFILAPTTFPYVTLVCLVCDERL